MIDITSLDSSAVWEALLREVGLEKDNQIDILVYSAYQRTTYIMNLKSKIAAKKLSENLLRISEQANKLADEMSSLPARLRAGISLSLINRESCNMTRLDTDVAEFLEKLSRAALHADEVLLKKIPDGKYNPLLVEIADKLFSGTNRIILLTGIKTKKQQKKALYDYWIEHKSRVIKSTAVVIAVKYMPKQEHLTQAVEAATRSINNNIEIIIEQSIELALKRYKAQQEDWKQLEKEAPVVSGTNCRQD